MRMCVHGDERNRRFDVPLTRLYGLTIVWALSRVSFLMYPFLLIRLCAGITSSKQNKAEEDRFFDGMLHDMLGLCVLPPLTGPQPTPGHWDLVGICGEG